MACRFILDGKDALEFRYQKGLCNLILDNNNLSLTLTHFFEIFKLFHFLATQVLMSNF